MVGLAGIAAGSSTDLQAILSEEAGLHGAPNGPISARGTAIDAGPELKRLKVESTVSSEANAPSRFESEGLEGFTDGVVDASQTNGRRIGDEEEEEEEDVYAVSPSSIKLERPRTAAQIAEDMKKIHGMWEMAAIIDFLTLFRSQLKLSREFGADELEHVLVAGTGDGGLLADLHADLLRGISPKSVIDTNNWVVHLANKIKFHWKGAPGGPPCPYRPEKYYEAVTYAGLPVEERVRALHFVCCVRLDREDCGMRIEDALRPLTRKELAEIEAAKEAAKSARSTRGSKAAAAAYRAPEDVDSFRKGPVGMEASGAAYYYLEGDMGCNRLYRESGAGYEQEDKIALGGKTDAGSDEPSSSSSDDDDDDNDDQGAKDEEGDRKKASAGERNEAAPSSPRLTRSGLSGARHREKNPPRRPAVSRSRRRAALLAYELPPEPAPRKWELVASTLPELEEIGERLGRSTDAADTALSRVIFEELVPVVSERQAAEAKRLRAAQRVARRLGGDPTSSFALDGRSRRERKPVNYAFTEFDDVMRSAIRRTQHGAEDELGGAHGGNGRGRHSSSPTISSDPAAEARAGLRRGRSAAHGGQDEGITIAEQVPDISERALRLARKAEVEREAAEEAARIAREEEEARRIQEEEEARQREMERLAAEEEERARQVEEAMRRAREARRLAMEHQHRVGGQGAGPRSILLNSSATAANGVRHPAAAPDSIRQSMPQPFGSGLQPGGWMGTTTEPPSRIIGGAPQFQTEENYLGMLAHQPPPVYHEGSRRPRTIGFRPPPHQEPWGVPGTVPPHHQGAPQLSNLNIAALNELLLQRQRQQHSSSAQGQLHGGQWG